MSEKKQLTYKEFKELYMKPKKQWDFDLFKITCKKCGSNKIEFNGSIEISYGDCYYPEDSPSLEGQILIKCHGCGNAHTIDRYQLEN